MRGIDPTYTPLPQLALPKGSKYPLFQNHGFGTRVLKYWVLGPSGLQKAQENSLLRLGTLGVLVPDIGFLTHKGLAAAGGGSGSVGARPTGS